MTNQSNHEKQNPRRGFKIATVGLFIGIAGAILAFLDPSTGDGGSGGFLFKAGFAVAAFGVLVAICGSIVHFVTMFEKNK